MTTPHGRLRGLRPFEALIGLELLAPSQRTSRMALAAAAGLPSGRPLADPVLAALRAEAAENPAA